MQSMTGFGTGRAQGDPGTVTLEIRSVNSRYLDVSFRMPEELRYAEMSMRDLISRAIRRGKIEVRASYVRSAENEAQMISPSTLAAVRDTYLNARETLPELQAPTMSDLLQWPDNNRAQTDPLAWVALCQQACRTALTELRANRLREGERLAVVMQGLARQVDEKVSALTDRLPELMALQQDRLATRMRDVLEQAAPLSQISPSELSERIHAEASLFSLRSDVAEELDRLRSHLAELEVILEDTTDAGGHGKRLDFLLQEMNREANTLGSKAAHLDITRTAMDLKLLVEQLREQIQNIE
ncbi:YicC/YloC family endoribonuclease [Orrella sp. 11846]|uniref:YicC/YloC family endoribonuclease n=1 Tax=Orrella sp. 11846 TaxID=3409913 RepID=UPI003B5A6573